MYGWRNIVFHAEKEMGFPAFLSGGFLEGDGGEVHRSRGWIEHSEHDLTAVNRLYTTWIEYSNNEENKNEFTLDAQVFTF